MQDKLILLRKKTNTTQNTLAELLNITPKTYSLKELGKSEFSIDEMFKISNYFHKSIDDIFLPRILQNGVKGNKLID